MSTEQVIVYRNEIGVLVGCEKRQAYITSSARRNTQAVAILSAGSDIHDLKIRLIHLDIDSPNLQFLLRHLSRFTISLTSRILLEL
jgi:hypothetical protein